MKNILKKILHFIKKFGIYILFITVGIGSFYITGPRTMTVSATEMRFLLNSNNFNINQIKKIYVLSIPSDIHSKYLKILFNNYSIIQARVPSPGLVLSLLDRLSVPVYFDEQIINSTMIYRILFSSIMSLLTWRFVLSGRMGIGSNSFDEIQVSTDFNIDNLIGMNNMKDHLHKYVNHVVNIMKNNETVVKPKKVNPKIKVKSNQNLPSVLLYGLPGNGKTYSVRAIAGTFKEKLGNCRLLSIAGGSFNEIYVGVGSKKIKELFNRAREIVELYNEMVIIFVDEMDSIGKRRSGNYGNQDNNNTINTLLAELDGIKRNNKILFIGSTNHPDSIDDALLRSGRIGNKLQFHNPTIKDIKELLVYELSDLNQKKVSLKKDDYDQIARIIHGEPRSSVGSLVENSKLYQQKNQNLKLEHFHLAINERALGIPSTDHGRTDSDLKNTAYHEACHAFTGFLFSTFNKQWPKKLINPDYFEIYMSTITPRSNALGLVYFIDKPGESSYKSYRNIARIIVCLAGRAGEYIYMGPDQLTPGCSSDLKQARNFIDTHIRFILGKNDGVSGSISDEKVSAYEMEQLVKKRSEMLKTLVDYCQEIISDNSESIHKFAKLLLKKDIVYGPEIYKCFNSCKINLNLNRFNEIFQMYSV